MVARLLLIAVSGVGAVALVSALAAPASSDATRLAGRTGPGFKITLTRAGREVDRLWEGAYTITIRDTSRSHNFVLTNWSGPVPHRRRLTTLAFVGTKTVKVVLGWGNYTYACSRHAARGMYESFIVPD